MCTILPWAVEKPIIQLLQEADNELPITKKLIIHEYLAQAYLPVATYTYTLL